MYSNDEKIPISKCLVGSNLSKAEIDFLESFAKINNYELTYFTETKNIHPLKNNFLFLPEFNPAIIETISDWCLEITVIGKISDAQKDDLIKSGIIRFWDLSKFRLEDLPLFIPSKKTIRQPTISSITTDSIFNKKLNSLFKDFQIPFYNTKNLSEFYYSIQNCNPEILILDWDFENGETGNIINDLRKIKKENIQLPPILGVKNLHKEDLFSSLSLIREFCDVLFSKQDIMELFINSLPFEKENHFLSQETRYFDWNISGKDKITGYSVKNKNVNSTDVFKEKLKNLYAWIF